MNSKQKRRTWLVRSNGNHLLSVRGLAKSNVIDDPYNVGFQFQVTKQNVR
ncbi:MAG TPA: hypothetical protein VI816_04195 [Candidatus Bathyarchaeia archaeon]|nr:hypothetical protein [Candidatus Bathyarchaeia archaeon]